MRKRAIGVAAIAAAVGMGLGASAASAGNIEQTLALPPPPTAGVDWTGFYVGLYAGGAWQSGAEFSSLTPYRGVPPHSWTTSGDETLIGGGVLGFNWQFGPIVAGVEAEIGYLKFENRAVDPYYRSRAVYALSKVNDWEEFIGGRLGYAWDAFLLYAKTGVLFAEYDTRAYDTARSHWRTPVQAWEDSTNMTWAVGGGLEYALTRQWSAKIEYLYLDFSATQYTGDDPSIFVMRPGQYVWSKDAAPVQTVRAGISYRFSGWGDESPFP